MLSETYKQLCEHFREIAVLGSIGALLDWDARCILPSGGAEYRSDQQAYLSNLLHQKRTDPRIGDWLDDVVDSDLTADPRSDSATVIREAKRIYDKQVKLPGDLVEALTRAENDGQHAWVEARKNDDFETFLPFLETTFKLKREQADAIGFEDCRYDALLDDFEPDEKTFRVRETLEAVSYTHLTLPTKA